MNQMKALKSLLQILEDTLDQEIQRNIENRHQKILNWEPVDRLPLVVSYPYPDSHPVQPFPHREIFDNPEKMMFNELVYAFDTSILLHPLINDDLPCTIRANFGTVIIASLFGGKVEQRADNPPWIRHFETPEEFESIFDRDPEDFTQGLCPQIVGTYRFYRDILSDYPNLQKCTRIVLPDLQGPLDTLELLRGSAVYTDFILEPEKVDNGLRLMARAQTGFAKHLQQFINDGPENYAHQQATAIKGNILIRNDSAIMISPEMYKAQVAPHDEHVLKEMGGGGIHSCGKIDFNIPEIFSVPSIRCFDFGQSYLNDLEPVYALAKEKKIPLIRIRLNREELLSGRLKERFPTGVSLVYEAASFEDAKSAYDEYRTRFS